MRGDYTQRPTGDPDGAELLVGVGPASWLGAPQTVVAQLELHLDRDKTLGAGGTMSGRKASSGFRVLTRSPRSTMVSPGWLVARKPPLPRQQASIRSMPAATVDVLANFRTKPHDSSHWAPRPGSSPAACVCAGRSATSRPARSAPTDPGWITRLVARTPDTSNTRRVYEVGLMPRAEEGKNIPRDQVRADLGWQ